ncbi:hypothetical protein PHSC3_001645 [Chlamydiales bacterium STE3]|nr:hypothetical protein PHSC3_001645 [Chlamydiales bacterium STE3]
MRLLTIKKALVDTAFSRFKDRIDIKFLRKEVSSKSFKIVSIKTDEKKPIFPLFSCLLAFSTKSLFQSIIRNYYLIISLNYIKKRII